MVEAADVVHEANPDTLIFFSGINSDTYIHPIPLGNDLGGGLTFNKTAFPYSDKIVLELHKYDNSEPLCSILQLYLDEAGFKALDTNDSSVKNVLPVVLTEFGYAQDMKTVQGLYATCIEEYILNAQAGWMMWVLAGSYYTRQGVQDYDESYGKFVLASPSGITDKSRIIESQLVGLQIL